MKYGLKETTIDRIKKVFSNYPEIERVILYGSRAKGNYKKGSDIDLTLIGSRLSNTTINKISCELDDLLLPYIFDLSIYHHITNNDLLEHINIVGVDF